MSLIIHPLPPLYDKQSRILILGSFPSVKSREGMYFYHHPQNRFWRILAALFEAPLPQTIAEKEMLLRRNGIALWDVIYSCEVEGSSDASIRNVTPTDLSPILQAAPIERIACNGTTAWSLYQKYQRKQTECPAVKLPSSSPANARSRLEDLTTAWKTALEV